MPHNFFNIDKLRRGNKKSATEDAEKKQVENTAFLDSLPDDIRGAAEHTDNNREELRKSKLAGCYYCLSIYTPDLIWEWIHMTSTEECPMCPYCGIDSVLGDASGYPVTKEFLRKMNKYWFGGDGDLNSLESNSVTSRYEGKILGIRNYEAAQQTFVTTDFINLDQFIDFLWEVSTGESDFTPAGAAFLHEYFDLASLADELSRLYKKLPPQGEGRTRKQRIKLYVDYLNSIEPMEMALAIAGSKGRDGGEKDSQPTLEHLD